MNYPSFYMLKMIQIIFNVLACLCISLVFVYLLLGCQLSLEVAISSVLPSFMCAARRYFNSFCIMCHFLFKCLNNTVVEASATGHVWGGYCECVFQCIQAERSFIYPPMLLNFHLQHFLAFMTVTNLLIFVWFFCLCQCILCFFTELMC